MSQSTAPPEQVLSVATIEAIAAQIVAKQPPPKRDYLTIVLPLVGVILGALVTGYSTYLVSSNLEPEKQVLQFQFGAYTDYVRAQAAWIRAQGQIDTKPDQLNEINLRIREAAMRMVIYSPVTLVNNLAEFISETPRPSCALSAKDIAIYQEMRREALKDRAGNLSNATVAMAIFGCEYKDKT